MATSVKGYRAWEGERDDEGHRSYTLDVWVTTTDKNDGPATALVTPGLPVIGTPWVIGNDADFWAWCRPGVKIKSVVAKEGHPTRAWKLTFTFSTKPLTRSGFSQGGIGPGGGGVEGSGATGVENPLLEPQKVSGSFVKYSREAVVAESVVVKDSGGTIVRTGTYLLNSAWEQIRGPLAEFDDHTSTLKISQNVAVLDYPLVDALKNRVNGTPIWGFAARCVKLSGFTWERHFHPSVVVYYTRVFDFDINTETFDRVVPDQGTKVLNGHWNFSTGLWVLDNVGGVAPDRTNPAHFMLAQDRSSNPISVMLDGLGKPTTGNPGSVTIKKYLEGNFLTLGVPVFI